MNVPPRRHPDLPDVVLTNVDTAGDMLSDPGVREWLRYAISIGSETNSPPPRGFKQFRRPRIRLEFDDIEVAHTRFGYVGATEEDVRRLVAFCKRVKDEPGPVLVHCAAGVSRSSAATLTLLAVLLGPDREADAVAHLLDVQEWGGEQGFRDAGCGIRPNRRIVWLADEVLGRGGALFRHLMLGLKHLYGQEWPAWTP